MDTLSLLLIALALALDAFAVSLAAGCTIRPLGFRPCFRLSFHFGLFQALMPVIGWTLGLSVRGFVEHFSHWIAFALLAAIGGNMIREALRGDDEENDKKTTDPSRGLTLLALAVATSIDALAVGLSLALPGTSIWIPALVIGIVASVMTLLGIYLGHRAGVVWGSKVEVLGGVVLILIGGRILLTGLGLV